MSDDPTTRFSSRVDDYVRYRPSYPPEITELLVSLAGKGVKGVGPADVADIGSGTGILTKSLMRAGLTVYGIEPNAAMRAAAEKGLFWSDKPYQGFRSVNGTAETTSLPEASVDLVVAAQAFHWFDRAAARREFLRILREPKRVALVWNERAEKGSPFLEGYEALLREFAGDYLAVRHRAVSPHELQAWFGGTMRTATFSNAQTFDFDGLLGRLLSSSYAPQMDDPLHAPMVESLRRLFDATAQGGAVEFLYETNVYYGTLG